MHPNLRALAAHDRVSAGPLKNGPRKTARFLFVLVPLAILTFVLVHVIWQLTLPVPWSDESVFIIPAINFYSHHNFTADQMFVHQIFWMPVHLYLVNGALFQLLNAFGLHISRALSFVFVTAAAMFLRSAVRSTLAVDRSNPLIGNALVAAWYVSLPIVFCADLMRPDALSLLLSTATIGLALKDRYLGALSVAVAAGVTHPLEAFPAVVVGICVLPLCSFRKASWLERLLILWAGGLFLFEGSRVISNFALYRLHMALQLDRKTDRHIHSYTYLLVVLVIPLLAYVLWRVFRRREVYLDYGSRQLITLLYALVCVFVTAFGQEMWYFIWELTGFTLLLALGFEWLQTHSAEQSGLPHSAVSLLKHQSVVVAGVLFALGLSTWVPGYRPRGVYGFYTNPTKLSEIREDQRVLRGRIIASLSTLGAERVLLPSSLYGFVISSSSQTSNLHFSTLSPFSDITDEALDHLVVLTRGYPNATTDSSMANAVPNRRCSPIASIVTPHGYYEASIIAVSAPDSLNASVESCGALRFK